MRNFRNLPEKFSFTSVKILDARIECQYYKLRKIHMHFHLNSKHYHVIFGHTNKQIHPVFRSLQISSRSRLTKGQGQKKLYQCPQEQKYFLAGAEIARFQGQFQSVSHLKSTIFFSENVSDFDKFTADEVNSITPN